MGGKKERQSWREREQKERNFGRSGGVRGEGGSGKGRVRRRVVQTNNHTTNTNHNHNNKQQQTTHHTQQHTTTQMWFGQKWIGQKWLAKWAGPMKTASLDQKKKKHQKPHFSKKKKHNHQNPITIAGRRPAMLHMKVCRRRSKVGLWGFGGLGVWRFRGFREG